MRSGEFVPCIPMLGRLIPIHTIPTGLFGPGGRLKALLLRTPVSRTDLSQRKFGIRILLVTRQVPMGTGNFEEPGVQGKQPAIRSFS